ncbi:hypothetical protein [Ensifer sp. LCM 4579]|uniref:hypothetical protein n=1 Tax=Ensifer sp. LCM 4579 TaxID=1848292 RepID=UPI0008D93AB9|nr:hypothetical protein [Ensifer sp. LCM 4579]OHV73360.1 hypothetical protein LCM4579_10590 [Ensifer sp. LCM 4579]
MNTDLNEHPFSPASVAREGGHPDRSERAWLRWVDEAERLLGHDLDGSDVEGKGCGYSLDEAFVCFARGEAASVYVATVQNRARYATHRAVEGGRV